MGDLFKDSESVFNFANTALFDEQLAIMQCVPPSDVFESDVLIPECSSTENPSKLDPTPVVGQGLDSLTPELAGAFPSPLYDSVSSTPSNMQSPTYSSNSSNSLDDELPTLDFYTLLADQDGTDTLFNFDLFTANPEPVENEQNSSVVSDENAEMPVGTVELNERKSDSSVLQSQNLQAREIPKIVKSSYTLRGRSQNQSDVSKPKGSVRIASNVLPVKQVTPATGASQIVSSRKRGREEKSVKDYELDGEIDPSNKAAIQAHINRQKKKAYIQGLETQVEDLFKDNKSLYTLRGRSQNQSDVSKPKGSVRIASKVLPVKQVTPATGASQIVSSRKRGREEKSVKDYELDGEIDPSNKAAIQARINRQKKKEYIQGLETQVEDLSKDNKSLKTENMKLVKETASLMEEVQYLKNVIANSTALSGLLSNIGSTNGVSLTTSFSVDRDDISRDHDYGKPPVTKARKQGMSGGVCLHVDSSSVSMEFCSKCAQMARGSGRLAQDNEQQS